MFKTIGKGLFTLAAYSVVTLLIAGVSHIMARILLPDMGLNVPGYWKFAGAYAIVVPIYALFQWVGELADQR